MCGCSITEISKMVELGIKTATVNFGQSMQVFEINYEKAYQLFGSIFIGLFVK